MDRYLDVESAPMPFLIEMAGWLGFAAEGDFLEEGVLRRLIREIYALNRIKGTKEVIGRLIRAVFGEDPVIVEQNRMGVLSQRRTGTHTESCTALPRRTSRSCCAGRGMRSCGHR